MAFALGFAGGFADAAVEPEPTPVVIGSGSGAPLFRRRWVPCQGQPAPPPVHIAVAIHVHYRWAASVTRVAPKVRLAQLAVRLSARVTTMAMRIRNRSATPATTAKVVKVEVDQNALNRIAEARELSEIALALNAWQQREL